MNETNKETPVQKMNRLCRGTVLQENRLEEITVLEALPLILKGYSFEDLRDMDDQKFDELFPSTIQNPGDWYDEDPGEDLPPLPHTYELNVFGALPYFFLVVGLLGAVGGWFYWYFVR